MSRLQNHGNGIYILPQHDGMHVPGLLVASDRLLEQGDVEKSLDQLERVAFLPGIVGYSIAMPDIHWGYGFPIGGVAATDWETGVVSPGGVGYDINCGVRLAVVPCDYASLNESKKADLLKRIFQLVPSGVGHGHKEKKPLSDEDYHQIAQKGARFSIEKGFGFLEDLDFMESFGVIEGANINAVSSMAKERGRNQLGSIGSGNHFIEIGEVEQIFLPEVANSWGVLSGKTYILIHSGSRGFGHQICQDTLDLFLQKGLEKGLPDKQLVCAPIQSEEGYNYLGAMAAAANYAFNNRQQILHAVRCAFSENCSIDPKEIRLIYDVCHNIAKKENHIVNGSLKNLCVHRKGATRAFGPGTKELAPQLQKTGQPVLVPGDMGRASFLLAGCHNPLSGDSLTWCSCCHGAGRLRSRMHSMRSWHSEDTIKYMKKQGVTVMATSPRTIAEEMPDAYKDVEEVVKVCENAGLAKIVARLKPHLVIKG